MGTGLGCNEPELVLAGETYARLAYGSETNLDLEPNELLAALCHDCGVGGGLLHHQHCDVEECPRCHGQRISCGCA
jgi:Zn finger protein HypA/HybF involved in hydrogenase expression